MRTLHPKNLAASVGDRLKKIARDGGQDMMQILIRYTNERFLYRLSRSDHRNQFVLKGATLFAIWANAPHRPTRDLDFLAFGDHEPEAMRVIFQEVCQTVVEDDGLVFLFDTVEVATRRNEEAYPGLHVDVVVALGNAQIPLKIDVGFGDAVIPSPVDGVVPVLLPDFAAPLLRVYRRETVIAEKLEAMVSLGLTNSRMKDYYDVWYLAQNFAFAGEEITTAVKATFDRRRTALPDAVPLSLTDDFALSPTKQAQWAAFLSRSGLTSFGPSLPAAITTLEQFLLPILAAMHASIDFTLVWKPGESWCHGPEIRF